MCADQVRNAGSSEYRGMFRGPQVNEGSWGGRTGRSECQNLAGVVREGFVYIQDGQSVVLPRIVE